MPRKAQSVTVDETNESQLDCKHLLEQQKVHFEQLLSAQEKNFKTFLESFMMTTNSRVDAFIAKTTSELVEIKHSLEFTQKEMDAMKGQTEIGNLHKQMKQLEDHCDYLENQSRRCNLRIDGIPETANENWSETSAKVTALIRDKLELGEIDLERAHRTGGTGERKTNRTVIVKLSTFKDRERILRAAKDKRIDNIYVNEDYSQKVIAKRKELLPKMMEARRAGKIAYLSFDKLVIRERIPRT